MAAVFLDSSALVKRYIQEVGTPWVSGLTASTAGNWLYVARITGVEVVSAITRKARTGGISSVHASQALAGFRADFPGIFTVVEVTPALASEAMRLAEAHFLRAYDAVQLAAVLGLKNERLADGLPLPTLISADTELNTAAQGEGLLLDDPNAHP
jgi:predicted nucleic acid-binding protein